MSLFRSATTKRCGNPYADNSYLETDVAARYYIVSDACSQLEVSFIGPKGFCPY
ncbi:hypothetical protein BS50DRAFT_580363 [Corynespora cassiicola Philippines]|uniref:Uncharacterized protein n=1 Tax=Corynespora cassiicola Philippines TaxID=1448308 RepID=A0A2T2N0I7_CORCC|nr:hypothetical protein BS50DRAFT_580363 [Corynespora cassiicola Philippines]